mmetsp:Transcript_9320/g.24478  ORF Transcript_9320/g.24478 Transcript_9320/m.24478 type:complete len:107 (+) Transcript_9320:178-498(+)|eukprot:CAMPEP_0174896986 /NCGR_PEP_ID=MMETSP0167-20121228/11204_1 /TAXON_ID=38298 /ORGANISM="Rhodella maculata, Strain CCMP736" /LENGTH=106 /DNA_ID=CAMNT_0016136691 /DNA_START=50 /DNA_END=370 /DNA_ORIENTATION=-
MIKKSPSHELGLSPLNPTSTYSVNPPTKSERLLALMESVRTPSGAYSVEEFVKEIEESDYFKDKEALKEAIEKLKVTADGKDEIDWDTFRDVIDPVKLFAPKKYDQ